MCVQSYFLDHTSQDYNLFLKNTWDHMKEGRKAHLLAGLALPILLLTGILLDE